MFSTVMGSCLYTTNKNHDMEFKGERDPRQEDGVKCCRQIKMNANATAKGFSQKVIDIA